MGIVTIPGVMTRAILDNTDIEQAARLQMFAVFIIFASNMLSCIVATHLALIVCVDSEHRIRLERIDIRRHVLCHDCSSIIEAAVGIAGRAGTFAISNIKTPRIISGVRISKGSHANSAASERTRLLLT
jgi:hypothetical protein